jgi:2-deoxy-D-gluconate 3-dehydrogenase
MNSAENIPVSQLLDLTGKAAIVTGGALGIGYGIANRLAEAGAQVLIGDINAEALEKSVASLSAKGYTVKGKKTDISSENDTISLVNNGLELFGKLDILVNNAGIYPTCKTTEMSSELWNRVLNTNLKGPFICCREAAKHMIARKQGGVIINITSIDQVRPSFVGLGPYDASKAGLHLFTKSLALELAPYNIRVLAVAPGGIWTEGTQDSVSLIVEGYDDLDQFFKTVEEQIPLKRMGTPDEIGRVVLFLASDVSSYMTGTTVFADGALLVKAT